MHLRIINNVNRLARRIARLRVRPAIARGHKPEIVQPKIRHSPRRGTNIFAHLRAHEED